jgi:hypothetical protein
MIAVTQLRFAARIPQKQALQITVTQDCFASDKEICVNKKLTFDTAVKAFHIFTFRKMKLFACSVQSHKWAAC